MKGTFLYEGKAKKIFSVKEENQLLWLEFKDNLTAFNGQKLGSFTAKGAINQQIAVRIFYFLKSQGIETHLVRDLGSEGLIVKKLNMIPLEVVVRNCLAGSTAKKFDLPEGTPMDQPLVEFYYKKDELNDPFVSDDQALMIKAVPDRKTLEELKASALRVNEALLQFFKPLGIQLVDFKLEYGRDQKGVLCLGDEITPDSCRLWDTITQEKLDKDRFRRDLGKVQESYEEVLKRILNHWGTES